MTQTIAELIDSNEFSSLTSWLDEGDYYLLNPLTREQIQSADDAFTNINSALTVLLRLGFPQVSLLDTFQEILNSAVDIYTDDKG